MIPQSVAEQRRSAGPTLEFVRSSSRLNAIRFRTQRRDSAIKIQAIVRGFVQRQKYKRASLKRRTIERMMQATEPVGKSSSEATNESDLDEREKELRNEINELVAEINNVRSSLRGGGGAFKKVQLVKKKDNIVDDAIDKTKKQLEVVKESAEIIELLLQHSNQIKERCEGLVSENNRLKKQTQQLEEKNKATEESYESLKKHGEELKASNQQMLNVLQKYKTKFSNVRRGLRQRRQYYRELERSRQKEVDLRQYCEDTLLDVAQTVHSSRRTGKMREAVQTKVYTYQRAATKHRAEKEALDLTASESSDNNSETTDGSFFIP